MPDLEGLCRTWLATSDLITGTCRRYPRSLLPIRDTAIAAELDEPGS